MSHDLSLVPGDILKIERRYLVDGVMTCVTDEGRFAGVQVVGSAEHLAIQTGRKKAVRMFPLHAISEITLVKAMPRAPKPAAAQTAGEWDPGVA